MTNSSETKKFNRANAYKQLLEEVEDDDGVSEQTRAALRPGHETCVAPRCGRTFIIGFGVPSKSGACCSTICAYRVDAAKSFKIWNPKKSVITLMARKASE